MAQRLFGSVKDVVEPDNEEYQDGEHVKNHDHQEAHIVKEKNT
jgi:hypothetical protein